MRKLHKPKGRKVKMVIKERLNPRVGVYGGSPVQVDPPPPSCIAGMINRAQEHNEALARLVDRTRTIGDRMFGGQPRDSSKDPKDTGGPTNALGVLETQLMVGENLACILLGEIQRLEVL
jgi:hypothetical protein